jgi:translocation and assembly module TamB
LGRLEDRGRGIDAEFGGDLKIGGTVAKPNMVSGFDLRRGKRELFNQRIDITRGELRFSVGLTPTLAVTAETTAADKSARLRSSLFTNPRTQAMCRRVRCEN